MTKLLVIIALMAAFLIIKHLINNPPSKSNDDGKSGSRNPDSLDSPENYDKTVQCDFCGTHIPLKTAYKAGDRHYCDESHYSKVSNSTDD